MSYTMLLQSQSVSDDRQVSVWQVSYFNTNPKVPDVQFLKSPLEASYTGEQIPLAFYVKRFNFKPKKPIYNSF